MNRPSLPPDAEAAFAHIEAEDARHRQQAADALGPNKVALFDVLAAAGISSVIFTFDGYGDEGQIENVDARGNTGSLALPDVSVEIVASAAVGSGLEHRAMPLAQAIEEIVYELLRVSHPGWENNDGAFGEFAFEVADRSITHEHHSRYTEIDSSVHHW